ncbi:MAG: Holliday junction resolvase RuvX [Azospirillum sp.]|nr:Holliday junction resolvase RuvX [Azospirillum sp.]
MAIRNLSQLKALLPRGQRLLGLDLGSRTIGLALSDPGLTVASPIVTLRRTKFTADALALAAIVAERGVGGLILGLPVNMDGTQGQAARAAHQFAANLLRLAERFPAEPEIAFWDERLSTSAVTRFMIEADMTRKRRAEVVDKAAAAYILQGALDALRHQQDAAGPDSISR